MVARKMKTRNCSVWFSNTSFLYKKQTTSIGMYNRTIETAGASLSGALRQAIVFKFTLDRIMFVCLYFVLVILINDLI